MPAKQASKKLDMEAGRELPRMESIGHASAVEVNALFFEA
jgi:hypothetical protein